MASEGREGLDALLGHVDDLLQGGELAGYKLPEGRYDISTRFPAQLLPEARTFLELQLQLC